MRESTKLNDLSAARVSTEMVTVMVLGRAFEHGQPELAREILRAAQDDGERVERIDVKTGESPSTPPLIRPLKPASN